MYRFPYEEKKCSASKERNKIASAAYCFTEIINTQIKNKDKEKKSDLLNDTT